MQIVFIERILHVLLNFRNMHKLGFHLRTFETKYEKMSSKK